MKCFLGGLGFGLIGLALWVVASVSDSVKGTHPYEWSDDRKVTYPGGSGKLDGSLAQSHESRRTTPQC